MRSTNVAENDRKCNYMLNFYSPVLQIDVDENDCNKTFRAPLTDHVISRIRRKLIRFLTQLRVDGEYQFEFTWHRQYIQEGCPPPRAPPSHSSYMNA